MHTPVHFLKKWGAAVTSRLLWLVLLGCCCSLNALAQNPTVTTDRADYLPGDVVVIEGDNWQPGEQVQLSIDHSTVTHGNTVLSATADASGHIYNDQYIIQPVHLGESFTLLATGLGSGWTASTTFTDGNAPGSLTVAPVNVTTTAYGTGSLQYTVLVKRLEGGNDNGSFSVALSMDPQSVSSKPTGVTYSLNPTSLQFAGGESSKSATLTISTTPEASAMAGAVSFRVVGFTANNNGNGNGNNNGVTVSGNNTFQIVPRPVTITPALNQSKTYGAADPVFSYSNSAGLSAGSFTGSLGRAPGENVGSYAYQLGNVSAGGNYQLSLSGTETFRIDKATTTLTFSNLTGQVYDGSNKAATVTTTPAGLSGVTVLYNGAPALPVNAGDYNVSATLTNTNYSASPATGTLRIAPASATITLNTPDLTQTYSGTAKTVGATASPTAAGVLVRYSQNGNTVPAPTQAGTYQVTASLTNANYQLVANGQLVAGQQLMAQLRINRAPQAISWNAPATLPYGTALSETQMNATRPTGDGALSYQPASGAVLPAGTHTLTVNAAETDNFLPATASVALTVTPKELTPVIMAASKTYDATATATISSRSLSGGIVGTDAVALSGGTASFPDKQVGTKRTVTATGLQLSGAAAGNYTLTATSATTTATISPATVTGKFTAAAKTYDATTAANIETRGLDGVLAQDEVTLTGGTATFASKTAGAGKTVTGLGFSLGGADADNYELDNAPLTTTASILVRSVTGSFAASNKVYDGGTTATVSNPQVAGALGDDAVSLHGGSASFADRHVGDNKTVTLSGASLSGADAANYHLASVATAAAAITPLSISGGFTAAHKTYDGTPAATVLTRTLNGVISPDVVALTGGTATFANKAAGPDKPVTLVGASLNGAQAGNYSLSGVSATTANIAARALQITATGNNKAYDGTTAATVSLQDNRLSDDELTLTYSAADFDTKHVGNNKSVTVTGLRTSGPDAGNYEANASASAKANITPKTLAITLQASNKVYDGTTPAAITALLEAGSGLVAGDAVTVSATDGHFANPLVGSGKTVTATVSKTGADAGNYTANATASATAAITRRELTASLTGTVSKEYDQTTAASLVPSNYALANAVAGDDVALNTPASGQYDNKQAGVGKIITVSGVALIGSDADNYSLVASTLTGPVGQITRRALLITATAQSKVYDGTTAATASLSDNRLAGDILGATYGSASFIDKKVGSNKAVAVLGLVTSGADASNYEANSTAQATASITRLGITGTISASNKTYDGLREAVATGSLSGYIPTDAVTATVTNALFDTPKAGPGKPVEANLALAGMDADNYTVNPTASTTADILPKALTASITAQNKVYDGTSTAMATGLVPTASLISGDVVGVAVSNATFGTRWAGTGKTVQATVALSGAAAGNYQLTATTASTTATISPLAITGTFTASNKVYDGTTSATITERALVGVLPVDAGQVSLTGGTASFASAAVGTNKEVTASGMSLSGAASPSYSLASVAPTQASITAAVPTVVVVSNTVQYSDNVTLVATITSATVQNELNTTGGTVEFLLTPTTGGTPVSLGRSAYPSGWSVVAGKATATRAFAITQAPGTYAVQAVFTPNAGNIGSVNTAGAGTLGVTPEDADLTYTGETYFTLPSATTTKFNVQLNTTVKDITAVAGNTDAQAGNISNAQVYFYLNSSNGPLLGSAPVALVAAADPKTGTASLLYGFSIDNAAQAAGGLTLTVYPVVRGHYTLQKLDPVTITLSMPGADFVTGGGYLLNTASSRGTLAGTTGAKTNFGFTMKYTKAGSNLKGQCNIIVRSNGRILQIKSNAINTLSVGNTTAAGTPAYFNTKANYTDITDPLNPVPGPGNLDLTVWMNDLTTGGQGDEAGIQLLNGSQLLFASNWNGTKTIAQGLGGGNVQVRNALASNATSAATAAAARPSTTESTLVVTSTAKSNGGLLKARESLLEMYPNPVTTGPATVHFRSYEGGKAQLYVYNEVGALVATLYNAEVRSGEDFFFTLTTEGWPTGVYLCRLIANGRVLNHRFAISR